jgi:hypothetical protein
MSELTKLAKLREDLSKLNIATMFLKMIAIP